MGTDRAGPSGLVLPAAACCRLPPCAHPILALACLQAYVVFSSLAEAQNACSKDKVRSAYNHACGRCDSCGLGACASRCTRALPPKREPSRAPACCLPASLYNR